MKSSKYREVVKLVVESAEINKDDIVGIGISNLQEDGCSMGQTNR